MEYLEIVKKYSGKGISVKDVHPSSSVSLNSRLLKMTNKQNETINE